MKGIGEAGTIASTATVYNAVIDALEPFGVDNRSDAADAGTRLARDAHRREGGADMFAAPFDYYRANVVRRGAAAAAGSIPDAKLLAGGHSLIPLLKLRLTRPTPLVDIGRIPELKGITSAGRPSAHRRADDARRARGVADV